jgi:hypothetical protein
MAVGVVLFAVVTVLTGAHVEAAVVIRLLGPLGLLPVPTKWTIQIGTPIMVPPADDGAGTDQGKIVSEFAEMVRGRIDAMIADILAHRRSILFG